MLSRRGFIQRSSLAALGFLLPSFRAKADIQETSSWVMPAEGDEHQRTWMGFGGSERIWGRELLPEVRRNLALIANTIAQYEPVTMLVRPEEKKLARKMLSSDVELLEASLDDLWLRDTGPIFVVNDQGDKAAINFNFNGWGEKQTYRNDAKVAGRIANAAGVPEIQTDLILEGGCIEVDGEGTAIITESCVLNNNRNPGVSKHQFEDLLMPLLGLDKIIWLPGIKGMDITDGHTDFYARFARPGVVLAGFDPDPNSFDHKVTLRHLELLERAKDAEGRSLELITLQAPDYVSPNYDSDDFAAGYIGYYECNDAIIMQAFGDKRADRAAKDAIQAVFPDHYIEQIRIDGIAAGGGSIHCATQQEPIV